MKYLYIHIGFHKTGTTTIQQAIATNREKLSEIGIISPLSGLNSDTEAHHNIAWLLRNYPPQHYRPEKGSYKDLIQEICQSSHDKFLISSEEFSTLEEKSVQKLRSALPEDIRAIIIVYLRRPEEWLPSWWGQKARMGYENKSLQQAIEVIEPDYLYKRIRNWVDCFGKENVYLRIYDEAIQSSGLLNDFWDTLGIPRNVSKSFIVPKDANVSPSARLLNLVSRINQQIKFEKFGSKRPMLPLYHLWLGQFDSILQNKYGRTPLKLTQAQRELVKSKFAYHNQLLAREFFQRDELFPETFSSSSSEAATDLDLTQEDFLNLLGFIGEKVIAYEIDNREKLAGQRGNNLDAHYALKGSALSHFGYAYLYAKIRQYRLVRLFIKLLNFWQIWWLTLLVKQKRLSIPKLFNSEWYLSAYPEVKASGIHPYVHFHLFWYQGYHPMPLFDVVWYMTQYPQFYQEGLNPLEHYERIGQHIGYRPCTLFDPKWYLAQYEDVKEAEIDPLLHYCYTGWHEGRNPSSEFNTNTRLEVNPQLESLNINPLAHYLGLHRLK